MPSKAARRPRQKKTNRLASGISMKRRAVLRDTIPAIVLLYLMSYPLGCIIRPGRHALAIAPRGGGFAQSFYSKNLAASFAHAVFVFFSGALPNTGASDVSILTEPQLLKFLLVQPDRKEGSTCTRSKNPPPCTVYAHIVAFHLLSF